MSLIDPATIATFVGGFATALVPVGKWVYDAKRDAHVARGLLEGHEQFQNDGVIDRLRSLEEWAEENADALREEGIEVPDPEEG